MPLIPSLRRALSRLFGGEPPGTTPRSETARSPARARGTARDPLPGTLIPVGHHVIFATTPREAERALLLMMEGADEPLRRACGQALQAVRAEAEEPAA